MCVCVCYLLGVCGTVCPFHTDGALREVSLAFASTPGNYLAHSAHRVGGRGSGGLDLRQTLHGRAVSRVSLCLCVHCVLVVHRAVCVCWLLGVRGTVCVLFSRTGRCARSHRTGPCQHSFPKGETSVRPRRMTGHTLPQPLCAAGPGSRATCSPLACLGTKVASARWCQSLPRGLLRPRFLAGRTDQCPRWLPKPTRAVLHLTWWPSTPLWAVFHRDS